jgi:phosphoribosylformylglycinamidine synthase subunit PurQ / glutaminase
MLATVVVFPGSNADAEMVHTLRDVVRVKTQVAWHKDTELPAGTDLVAIPGGFSYGDYLRCGAIAKASPILGAIRRHAERGGFVLGVCNGFQILTEAGLLPGALTRNIFLRFECRDVFVTPAAEGPFTSGLPRVLRLPVAHAEGRYQASPDVLAALEAEGRVALQYCDANGAITPLDVARSTILGPVQRWELRSAEPSYAPKPPARPSVSFPPNPNGSVASIAGIYGGPNKNVFGLMPHPERMSEPLLGGSDGRFLFDAVIRAASGRAS